MAQLVGHDAEFPRESLLTASDSVWLRMDHPHNLMTVTGALMLNGRVPFDLVRAQLEERLARYRQFRQRVVQPRFQWFRPRWVTDPNFSIDRHTEQIELTGAADKTTLQDFVSALLKEPLPPDRPLWRMYYVKNYASGSALIARVHHCLGDGMALLHVLLNLSDRLPDMLAPSSAAPWALGRQAGSRLLRLGTRLWAVVHSLGLLAQFVLSRADPLTPLRGKIEGTKRVVWSEPVDLGLIKQIGSSVKATVNDVLLSVVAAALGTYLERTGTPCQGLTVRAAVPVNLRGEEDIRALGNRFGLVFLQLPVGNLDPKARLMQIRSAMERIKRSPEAFVWFALLRALGRVTPRIESLAVEFLSRKASLIISNVVGPIKTLQFSNTDVDDMMFWVPSTGRVGVGLSILSYRGKVCLGLATDTARVPHPERIIEAFHEQLHSLCLAIAPPGVE